MRLEEGIDLRWPVNLCFGLLGYLIVRQYGKFHYDRHRVNATLGENETELD